MYVYILIASVVCFPIFRYPKFGRPNAARGKHRSSGRLDIFLLGMERLNC